MLSADHKNKKAVTSVHSLDLDFEIRVNFGLKLNNLNIWNKY